MLIVEDRIDHYLSFSEFPRRLVINVKKKLANVFKMQFISILTTCSPRQLFLLLERWWDNLKQNWTIIFGFPLI